MPRQSGSYTALGSRWSPSRARSPDPQAAQCRSCPSDNSGVRLAPPLRFGVPGLAPRSGSRARRGTFQRRCLPFFGNRGWLDRGAPTRIKPGGLYSRLAELLNHPVAGMRLEDPLDVRKEMTLAGDHQERRCRLRTHNPGSGPGGGAVSPGVHGRTRRPSRSRIGEPRNTPTTAAQPGCASPTGREGGLPLF